MDLRVHIHHHYGGRGRLAAVASAVVILSWLGITPLSRPAVVIVHSTPTVTRPHIVSRPRVASSISVSDRTRSGGRVDAMGARCENEHARTQAAASGRAAQAPNESARRAGNVR
jgi:hypothetical protein